jgi:hypothetical protein
MKSDVEIEEFRWQIMKAMLDETPSLVEKVKSYVEGI